MGYEIKHRKFTREQPLDPETTKHALLSQMIDDFGREEFSKQDFIDNAGQQTSREAEGHDKSYSLNNLRSLIMDGLVIETEKELYKLNWDDMRLNEI